MYLHTVHIVGNLCLGGGGVLGHLKIVRGEEPHMFEIGNEYKYKFIDICKNRIMSFDKINFLHLL